MGPGRICILVLCIFLYFQDTLQREKRAPKCRRTNKKPFRYCLGRQCTTNRDCRANEQCLCDRDCGLSCVRNGTKCKNLETPKGLRLRLSDGTKVGSVASFSCRGNQYTLRGSKKRVCRGIGKWDGKATKCRILCKHPGDIANGNNNGDKKLYRVGSLVSFWCFPNYDMEGKNAISCNNKGKWSPSPPKCTAPSCAKPTPPDNAFIHSRRKLKKKYKYNEVVMFRCEHGYHASGSSFRRCLSNGWSNSNFRCIPKSCGDPGRPVNGRRDGYVFTFKNKVFFKCNRGYKLRGPQYRQCQANQKWSDNTPTCEPIRCVRLKDPVHGEKIEETSINFGGKVVFHCTRKGFELKGSRQRVCGEHGEWTGTNTTCERVVCNIPKIHNGKRIPEKNKYVFEDQVKFSCDTNYTLSENGIIICQYDRSLSRDVPRCSAPCKDPGIPVGSDRLQHSFLHNSIVQFRCKPRWTMEGSHTIRCNNGKWDYSAPTCSEGCSRPKRPGNGGITSYTSKNFYDHKDRVRFYCYRYYKLVGDEYSTCRDGVWTTDPPECKRICGNPGRPANGGYSGSEFFEGREITFYCQYGLDLIGSQSTRCLSSGRWSARRPECKRRCNYSRIPYNAASSSPRLTRGQRYKHDTTISFSCRDRYTLVGQKTIRCNDGRWSSTSIPVCKAPCYDPGPLQYGQMYGSDFLHGKQVSYTCLGLYVLEGTARLTCNNGRWDRTKPSCKAPCSDPGSLAKGYKRDADYRHGKSVSYTCQRGTRLVGRSSLTCNNGQWSSPLPKCSEICPVLRTPKNGYIHGRKSEYLSGEKATFQCNSRRYDLVGNKEIICTKGVWSGEIPFCLGLCQVPNNLDYGVISSPLVRYGQWIKHGTKMSFSCRDDNKLLDGERQITCNDGTWSSPKFPTCKVPCSDPGPIRNGTRRSTNFTVEYKCFQGYTLVGSSQRNCVGGRWSSNAPQCFENCRDPGSPTYGVKTGTDYRHGQGVFYRCTGLTRLRGNSRLTCKDGQWSSAVPKCLEKCPTLQRPTNGRYLINKNGKWEYLSSDKVVYECSSGYDLVGNRELHCDRGRWNGSAPICADRCKIHHNPTGVKFVATPREPGVNLSSPASLAQGFRHGTVLTFSCDGNKVVKGSPKVFCNKGRWSKDLPKCEVPCKSLVPISNGRMGGSQFRVQYECDSGYTLIGNSVITCSQGTWSSGPPSCMRDCSNPHSNGIVTGSDYRHGQLVSFRCHKGFRLNGNDVLMCNDGTWNDTIPTCIGVCQSLVAPKNGELLDNRFDYNAVVRFKCNEGYDIVGSKMLICRNGIWNNIPPLCKGQCSDPGVPRHGRRRGDSFTHQQTVEFFCNSGYELFGDGFIRCNEGRWSNPTPTCEAGCPDPGVPTGMTRIGFSLRSRSSLTYSCIPPFHISGNAVITCKDGTWSDNIPTCSDCGSPLGMESGKIPDGSIQASSTRFSYHAKHGRLNGRYAWCSGMAREPYLQIDFGKPYRITGLATQGSAHDNKWVEQYTVTSNLAGSSFNMYRENYRDKIFTGNRDKKSINKTKLINPVLARKLRINPHKKGGFSSFSPACMRVEIYGCDLPSDCVMVGSRVVAKWVSYGRGATKKYIYYKAYLTSISTRYWKVELENSNHVSPSHKYFLKYEDLPFVLDVPPKNEELQVGTRVLVPWEYRYYTGTIKTGRGRNVGYRVRADDGDVKDFTIDQIRLLKAPTFCN